MNTSPAAPPIISPRIKSAPVSAVSPAPRAWATSPVVPMRRKPKIQ